jgi:hypothetical protein
MKPAEPVINTFILSSVPRKGAVCHPAARIYVHLCSSIHVSFNGLWRLHLVYDSNALLGRFYGNRFRLLIGHRKLYRHISELCLCAVNRAVRLISAGGSEQCTASFGHALLHIRAKHTEKDSGIAIRPFLGVECCGEISLLAQQGASSRIGTQSLGVIDMDSVADKSCCFVQRLRRQ